MSDLEIPYNLLKRGGGNENSGRKKNCGLSIIEELNRMADPPMSEAELRKIARTKTEPWTRRVAAERIIRAMEFGDLADFEPLMDGQSSMRELRHAGINTEVLKKVKTKRREIPNGDNAPTVEVEREIELHDRSGADFDRIIDRAHGKPDQVLQVVGEGMPAMVVIVSPMTKTRQIASNSQSGEETASLEAGGATDRAVDG